ncbi:hypothetical protein G7074_16205 [Pedobacter sp. HDW13]|uniref:hypothetical protein n=1 Tax=Pedobacter sp. HDW13 TaxID=2714940 RepID=UPI00140D14F2|nr:hypothetical protein [Pedobacter sp. HDW13]QIL40671.1 hypothetical protein G7074_16205 [Pedobacter sp. HDW13]
MIENKNSRSVITFATNKEAYFKMALNCARSILLYNKLNVYIVTNLNLEVPSDLQEHVFKLQADPEHAKMGIAIKLYTDLYLQTTETLFIDSDCLCYADLSPLFDACQGKETTVVGFPIGIEEFCGSKAEAQPFIENFGIDQLIRFNGGFYYIKKSATSTSIYNQARSIMPIYDSLGFGRIGGIHINDEWPMSIAITAHLQTPITDNGTFITDLYTSPHPYGLNVLKGKSKLNNPPPTMPKHRRWYINGNYSPIIVHFGGNSLRSFPYNKQNLLLLLHKLGFSRFIASAISWLLIEVPYFIYYKVRTFFGK